MVEQIRVVRLPPAGVTPVAPQALTWGGYIDWVQNGTPADIPPDAVYAMHRDAAGVLRVVVTPPEGFVTMNDFGGWSAADISP